MTDELPKKSEFSKWYNEILRIAKIVDVRYPVKGFYAWYPFGSELKNQVFNFLKKLHRENNHSEVQFPLLIPRTQLMKEAEHVASFEDEVFWVDRAGENELDEPLALRPTSETSIYPLVKEWIRSHSDLPMKLFQVVNTFRYETKHTRPLIREREISDFKEAHTFHRNQEEVKNQIDEAMDIYGSFFDELCVPFVVSRRPDWDKFPGADYTYAFDTLMPDGKALQIGTIHNLGKNFSKTFDLDYENKEGEIDLVHQTSYGISGRSIASLISVHGDENGLVIPPKFSPIQVVIVPILFSDSKKEEILDKSKEIKSNLEEKNIRVVLDDSDDRPGSKFYKWELKGVPVRIEIGPRDIEENKCVLVRRDKGKEIDVGFGSVTEEIIDLFEEIKEELKNSARKQLKENIHEINSTEEGIDKLQKGGFLEFNWCGNKDCGKEIEDKFDADLLGTRLDKKVEETETYCINCKKEGNKRALIAKTY